MALDGIAVNALVCEFKNQILGAKIDKIHQPEKDELSIAIRSREGNCKLLLSASSSNARAHFQNISKTNPITAPQFCMLLRKHLCGGKIIDIRQIDFERLIDFYVESYTELGDLTVKHLIIEIMGRHSNIILTDEKMKILDSIKHIDFTVSRVRQVLPGLTYELPPPQNKLNPLDAKYLDVAKIFESASDGISVDKLIMQSFSGISPIVAREMCFTAFGHTDIVASSLSLDMRKKICDVTINLFNKIIESDFSPCIVMDKLSEKPIDFCALDIKQYESMADTNKCSSISDAVEQFYSIRDSAERKKQKSADLVKLIHNNIDRCAKKIVLLNQTIKDAEKKDKHKIYGDLITANLYRIKQGEKSVMLENFYSESMEQISVPLDVSISPQANAQKYYKKYNKAKTSEIEAAKQLDLAEKELAYLESILQNCSLAQSESDLNEIREELVNSNYMIKRSRGKKKQQKMSQPLHFISSDGFDIYVGKNNVQNDYLTLRLANASDIWFHTKNFAGSHTVIKLGIDKNVPDNTIIEAATLAAYHSSAKNSSQVPVDYTEIRNVKKPSGAKPGMVIYDHYNTIYAMPDEKLIDKLKDLHI